MKQWKMFSSEIPSFRNWKEMVIRILITRVYSSGHVAEHTNKRAR